MGALNQLPVFPFFCLDCEVQRLPACAMLCERFRRELVDLVHLKYFQLGLVYYIVVGLLIILITATYFC